MASKTVSDRGATVGVSYRIQRSPLEVQVKFTTVDGDERSVLLTAADVVANTTAAERTSLASIFDTKLYAAALAKGGFV